MFNISQIFQIVMERANLVKGISNVAELEKKIGSGQVRLFCGMCHLNVAKWCASKYFKIWVFERNMDISYKI